MKDFLTEGCKGGPCAYWILGIAYLVLAVTALIQFVRIQLRLSDSGWTLQKAFHLFNVVLCLARGITLFFWHEANEREYHTAEMLLLDVPTLMFFTTYTVLALFWAEISYSWDQASAICPPRYVFLAVNFLVYSATSIAWVMVALGNSGGKASEDGGDQGSSEDKGEEEEFSLDEFTRNLSTWFQIGLNFGVAVAFVIYGSKLLTLLRDSAAVAEFKRSKMTEVAAVGILCVICFLSKAVLEIVMRWRKSGGEYGDDDVLLNSLFFGVTEVLVISAALGLLSDLPPPVKSEGAPPAQPYQPVADEA